MPNSVAAVWSADTSHLLAALPVGDGKLEAWSGRGGGDHLRSHDLEDVIRLVDGMEPRSSRKLASLPMISVLILIPEIVPPSTNPGFWTRSTERLLWGSHARLWRCGSRSGESRRAPSREGEPQRDGARRPGVTTGNTTS